MAFSLCQFGDSLKCKQSCGNGQVTAAKQTYQNWGVLKVDCTTCTAQWYMCCFCDVPISQQSSVRRHIESESHKKKTKQAKQQMLRIEHSKGEETNQQCLADSFFNEKKRGEAYFHFEITKQKCGVLYLVARSQFPKDFDWSRDSLDADEAYWDFFTARSLNRMTRGEREAVMKMNSAWYDLGRKHMAQDKEYVIPPNRRIVPSKTYAEQDRRYFRGVHAITMNIPHPPVERFDDHHAMVDIRDCLKDALARGTVLALIGLEDVFDDIDPNASISLITMTRRAKMAALNAVLKSTGIAPIGDLLGQKAAVRKELERVNFKWEDVFVCLYIVWTDGIEPNAIKQGRNSVWAGSVTCHNGQIGTQGPTHTHLPSDERRRRMGPTLTTGLSWQPSTKGRPMLPKDRFTNRFITHSDMAGPYQFCWHSMHTSQINQSEGRPLVRPLEINVIMHASGAGHSRRF